MRGAYEALVRPLAFRADPEWIHEQSLRLISAAGAVRPAVRAAARLRARNRRPVTVAGITFTGRVGLAAGMDKDAVGLRTWAAMGFSHVEVGTVTAQPQPGNDRPRLFRLPASGAIVNRMGFNNRGAEALAGRLAAAGGFERLGLRVGVSIGKTKFIPIDAAVGDYLSSLRRVAAHADYVAVNVSSPNTPGLRTLQDPSALHDLLTALVAETRLLDASGPVPLLVKIAPDLDDAALDELLEVCQRSEVRGLVATNTTLARDGIGPADVERAAEAGGLSGAPLTVRAREVVGYLTRHTDLPVIGVGGIMTADDGRAMLDAGASLLQTYTGFVYRGPRLVAELNALSLADRRS